MSCYETHTGTLKKVECDSIEQFLKDKLLINDKCKNCLFNDTDCPGGA